jgi:cytochrome P450
MASTASRPTSEPTSTPGEAGGVPPTSPFLDPAYMDDPYPRLAKLRAEDPVHFVSSLGFWVILRHDEVGPRGA